MTDQQATALVELAACPDHRRETESLDEAIANGHAPESVEQRMRGQLTLGTPDAWLTKAETR